MTVPAKPEFLLPQSDLSARRRPGGRFITDENLDLLAHLLDDWFRIPGTSIRFGLDGVIGLVPGLGDVLTGLVSCIIPIAAWMRGVPYVTLARMVVNLGLDVVIGAVPFLGDAFDIAWKANRRNYALLIQRIEQPRPQTWRDWIFLGLISMTILAILIVPLLMFLWLLEFVRRYT